MLITPIDLHWITPEMPEADLCVHGGIRITHNDETFLDTGPSDHAVSTAGLHLLRTLKRDHTPENRITDHLFPCCGHFMVYDPEFGEVVNINCGNGVDWIVQHLPESRVRLSQPGGSELVVNEAEWTRGVVEFAKSIQEFYARTVKKPASSQDAEWYGPFTEEFDRRLREAQIAA